MTAGQVDNRDSKQRLTTKPYIPHEKVKVVFWEVSSTVDMFQLEGTGT